MKNSNRLFREAAYRYGNRINSHVGDNNFIAGAKSKVAKEFHQQKMYSEVEVFNLLTANSHLLLDFIQDKLQGKTAEKPDLLNWFNTVKKK